MKANRNSASWLRKYRNLKYFPNWILSIFQAMHSSIKFGSNCCCFRANICISLVSDTQSIIFSMVFDATSQRAHSKMRRESNECGHSADGAIKMCKLFFDPFGFINKHLFSLSLSSLSLSQNSTETSIVSNKINWTDKICTMHSIPCPCERSKFDCGAVHARRNSEFRVDHSVWMFVFRI